jgi:putative transcriptional regulator
LETKNIADRIRDQRKRYGWTQVDLAKKLGVTHITISYWETGRIVPPQPMQQLLERIFKDERG